MNPKEYIEFRIEIAENMKKGKVVLFANPIHKEMLSRLLAKLQKELKDKYNDDDYGGDWL